MNGNNVGVTSMKKIEKRLLLGALLATLTCSAIALTACDDNKDSGGAATPPPVVTPSKPDLQLSTNAIDVLLGNSVQLTRRRFGKGPDRTSGDTVFLLRGKGDQRAVTEVYTIKITDGAGDAVFGGKDVF